MKIGNSIELANDPIAPSVFMAAERVPEAVPPTSQQTVQLELRVKSTPEVVKAKQATKYPAEGMKGAATKVAVATPKPNMAGSARDIFQRPAL
jgi:hypothetical protein